MLRLATVFLILALASPIIGGATRSLAQPRPRVEWLGCIETFVSEPTRSLGWAYPNAVNVGLVSRCPRQVVGLICVKDPMSRSWIALHNGGRRVDPGGTLQETLPDRNEYASVDTRACYENSVCDPDTIGWGCSTLGGN